jgi:DNA processing protein
LKTDEQEAWLRLAATPGLDRARLGTLLSQQGATAADAKSAATAGDADETMIDRATDWLVAASDHHIVSLGDPRYPDRLRQVPDPPLLLFVRGDPSILGDPTLAMVGSRNPSPAGADNAHEFARYLSRCGFSIASGLALGVDAAAHRGALLGGSPTVAILGSGPDRVYPEGNRELADAIVGQGAVVSEFFPGSPPRRAHFPRRNRIISGLSLGVLVVEAGLRSGSLISARLAAEQGREVFAIPGSIHNPMARGCHVLIKQGAKLVESAEDVLGELSGLIDLEDRPEARRADESPGGPAGLSDDQQELLDACGYDPFTIDEAAARAKLTPAEVSSMLLILELQGFVESGPGGRYTRVSKGS